MSYFLAPGEVRIEPLTATALRAAATRKGLRFGGGGLVRPTIGCRPRVYRWGGVWRWECTGARLGTRFHPAEFRTWDGAVDGALLHWYARTVIGVCCSCHDKNCRCEHHHDWADVTRYRDTNRRELCTSCGAIRHIPNDQETGQ